MGMTVTNARSTVDRLARKFETAKELEKEAEEGSSDRTPLIVITVPPSMVVSALMVLVLVTVIVAAAPQLKVTVPSGAEEPETAATRVAALMPPIITNSPWAKLTILTTPKISVTPIALDLTNHALLEELARCGLERRSQARRDPLLPAPVVHDRDPLEAVEALGVLEERAVAVHRFVDLEERLGLEVP